MSKVQIFLLSIIVILITLIVLFYLNNPYLSRVNGNTSHNFGTDCSSCHSKSKEDAVSHFTVSGSVLNESRTLISKNAVIHLSLTPRARKIISTIFADSLGNFFSNEEIDFSKGLYPSLYGTLGIDEDRKHMRIPVFNGNCNSCHGISEEKLGID
jgi:hypothetical protein